MDVNKIYSELFRTIRDAYMGGDADKGQMFLNADSNFTASDVEELEASIKPLTSDTGIIISMIRLTPCIEMIYCGHAEDKPFVCFHHTPDLDSESATKIKEMFKGVIDKLFKYRVEYVSDEHGYVTQMVDIYSDEYLGKVKDEKRSYDDALVRMNKVFKDIGVKMANISNVYLILDIPLTQLYNALSITDFSGFDVRPANDTQATETDIVIPIIGDDTQVVVLHTVFISQYDRLNVSLSGNTMAQSTLQVLHRSTFIENNEKFARIRIMYPGGYR